MDDASDAKNVIDVATSLTVTTLFKGVFSLMYLLYLLSAKYFFVLGVNTILGQTLFTLILYLSDFIYSFRFMFSYIFSKSKGKHAPRAIFVVMWIFILVISGNTYKLGYLGDLPQLLVIVSRISKCAGITSPWLESPGNLLELRVLVLGI